MGLFDSNNIIQPEWQKHTVIRKFCASCGQWVKTSGDYWKKICNECELNGGSLNKPDEFEEKCDSPF